MKNTGKVMALLLLTPVSVLAGVLLTVENDFVFHTDQSYTHGTELAWQEEGITNALEFGIRMRMYSPIDTGCATNQPGDRPWAGITTVFYDWYYMGGIGDRVKMDIEVGVLGPDSMNDEAQTFIHKIIGSRTPMGWSNQVPNEPAANITMERRLDVFTIGAKDGFSLGGEALYGGTVGTTFDNTKVGGEIKTGWRVPQEWSCGINPKLSRDMFSSISGYAFAGADGMLVLHNATLGHSFFRCDDSKWDRDVNLGVWEAWWGLGASWRGFSAKWVLERRSEEFAGQPSLTHWGMITLGFGASF